MSEIERQLGRDAARIARAGLATQRSSVICWDRDDVRPLSNVISWQDRRAAKWLEGFAQAGERVHAITGLVLSPHYGVSKLRWCLDELDTVRSAEACTAQVVRSSLIARTRWLAM